MAIDADRAEIIEWIRDRPPYFRELMLEFPPGCWVQAAEGEDLLVPAAGEIAPTMGYYEHTDEEGHYMGLWVVDIKKRLRAQVRPEWVEFVRPDPDGDFVIDRAFVESALSSAS